MPFLRHGALPAALILLLVLPARAQTFFDIGLEKVDDPAVAGAAVWADLNADGNLDLVLTGSTSPPGSAQRTPMAMLYRHLGIVPTLEGAINRLFEHPLDVGVWLSYVAPGDVDGDGDLELYVCGAIRIEPPYEPIGRVYALGDDRNFRLVQELEGLYGCAADWGDVDNDGDLDLVTTGSDAGGIPRTTLYRNDRGTLGTSPDALPDLANGHVRFANADGDADLDLAMMGMDAANRPVTEIFLNENGSFHASGAGLRGVAHGSLDWGDYDGDGDQDLLATGARHGPALMSPSMTIYRNEGGRAFVDDGNAMPGKFGGRALWADWDNDGDLDAVSTGTLISRRPDTDLHRNDSGAFRVVDNACPNPPGSCLPFEPITLGQPLVFDVDDDYDLDVMIVGLDGARKPFLQVDRNGIINIPQPESDIVRLNLPPLPPQDITASVGGGVVTLSWTEGIDIQPEGSPGRPTAAAGLTYNMRVGTSPGGGDVMPAMSIPDTGTRQVVRSGNVGGSHSWHLSLPPGTYYWSVQSVDNSFMGSHFADEGSFVVP